MRKRPALIVSPLFGFVFCMSVAASERQGGNPSILDQLDASAPLPIQPSWEGMTALDAKVCVDPDLGAENTCPYVIRPAAASRDTGSFVPTSSADASPDDRIIVPAQADSGPAAEGGLAGQTADELARQSSNPLGGDFWILLNQFDNYFMQGDITDDTQNINTWAFQPVVPIGLGGNWILVNRPTFPFILNADLPDTSAIEQRISTLPDGIPSIDNPPPGSAPFRDRSGFGDIVHFSLLGQSIPTEQLGGGDWVWGLGPTLQFPTASSSQLGSEKWSAGPAAVGAFIGKKFILGGLMQNWFSFASAESGRADVRFSWLNLFYFLNFEDGWQVGGTPVITADWEGSSDDRWTVPIGLGVYKTHFFGGKLPMKLGVEAQYMPVSPDTYGQEFNIRFVIAPIIPSLF